MIALKRLTAIALSILLLICMFGMNVNAEAIPFVDLPDEGHWAHDAILWAYDAGITKGVDSTHFAPNQKITRAQAVFMVWCMKNRPDPSSTGENMPFQDVNPNAYYYNALVSAWEQGWVYGVSAETFRPNAVCTRAHVVAILGRAFCPEPASLAEDDDEEEPVKDVYDFVDVHENDYFFDTLRGFAFFGIIVGTDATHFSPNKPCTRAEFVTILYKLFLTEYYF